MMAMQTETAAPSLRWFNENVAIGTETREAEGPILDIWEVA